MNDTLQRGIEKKLIENFRKLSPEVKADIFADVEKKVQEAQKCDCKHLRWEMEGSTCAIRRGTEWGRCAYSWENYKCPYFESK